MPVEPEVKRTIAFLDGQNLFYAAKDAFGYSWPNEGLPRKEGHIASAAAR